MSKVDWEEEFAEIDREELGEDDLDDGQEDADDDLDNLVIDNEYSASAQKEIEDKKRQAANNNAFLNGLFGL